MTERPEEQICGHDGPDLLADEIRRLRLDIEIVWRQRDETIVRAKAAEHAHEFAQQQHVETFAKLCEVERIVRREDYTAVYDLLNDLRVVFDV